MRYVTFKKSGEFVEKSPPYQEITHLLSYNFFIIKNGELERTDNFPQNAVE